MSHLINHVRRLSNVFLLLNENRKAFKSKSFLVLPHLGYGDMFCCLPMFQEMVSKGFNIQVFSPAGAIPLLNQVCESEKVVFLPVEDFLSDNEFGTLPMTHRARRFGKRHGLPVLFLGQDLWWLHSKVRPDIDIGTTFFRLGRTPLVVHKNFKVGDLLRSKNPQFETPAVPYALIDHFPGTAREISESALAEIENKGVTLVNNPRNINYENLVDLIESASELHLVNSSLLCFALILNPNAKVKVVYPLNKYLYPGINFYDDTWQEKALHSEQWIRYDVPLELDRVEEYMNLVHSSRKLHLRFIDFMCFRNYKSPLVD